MTGSILLSADPSVLKQQDGAMARQIPGVLANVKTNQPGGIFMSISRRSKALLASEALVPVTLPRSPKPEASAAGSGWCSKVKIGYLKGEASDAFSDILEKGARAAAADTGANVTIIGSGWDFPKVVQGFREEIAKKPDAISFMGHPGNGAIHPLTIQAQKAGIFGSLPGPMMMFSGGEIGIEDLLPQLAKLKAGPVWQHGEVSWWCSDDTPKNVFGLTRTLGNASVSLVANIGDEPANFSPTRSLVGVKHS